jgi:hypothetical protein
MQELSFGIQVVDAQAFAPSKLGFITGDPTQPVGVGWDRTGALADGASVLVVRLTPVNWAHGPVTFTISSAAGAPPNPGTPDYIGSLNGVFPTLPAPDSGGGLGATSVVVGAASPKIVFYRPPNNLLFWSATGPLNTVPLTITASGLPGGAVTATILLVRTPLLLNHGFNSNPATWAAFVRWLAADGATPGVLVVPVDWSMVNTAGFDVITPHIVDEVNDTISTEQDTGIAATRVDVFGHSAGSVMVEWWASDFGNISLARPAGWPGPLSWPGNLYPYRTPANFGVGGIRRFVSVGGPFWGSAWADYVAANFTYPQVVFWATAAGMTGDQSIFYDLGVQSTAMSLLPTKRPAISWCPIVGIANPKTITALITSLSWVNSVCGSLPSGIPSALGFTMTNSDWIVTAASQISVATGGARPPGFIMPTVANITHDDETSDFGVWLVLEKSIDVFTDPQGGGGYSPGYMLFNAGF